MQISKMGPLSSAENFWPFFGRNCPFKRRCELTDSASAPLIIRFAPESCRDNRRPGPQLMGDIEAVLIGAHQMSTLLANVRIWCNTGTMEKSNSMEHLH
jgi:hypothetical protein